MAVDGADGAGKTTFAAALTELLAKPPAEPAVASMNESPSVPALDARHVSVDGFHRPRRERYARGRRSPEGFWSDSYDYDALHRELLGPWRQGSGSYRTAVHDVAIDEPVQTPSRPVPSRGVLVVDGIFLLRDELVGGWDLAVRLEASAVERFRRMAARDGSPAGPDHPDNRRYLLGQRLYEDACDPVARADLVVQCDRWDRPHLLRGNP